MLSWLDFFAACTTMNGGFIETLDYIWLSDHWSVSGSEACQHYLVPPLPRANSASCQHYFV